MANTDDNESAQALEQQVLGLAKQQVAELRSVADTLPGQTEAVNRLFEIVTRISGVFASVSDRLGDTTFKAMFDVTNGKPPREISVGIVSELADLASVSLRATNELKRELDTARNAVAAVLPIAPRMAAALRHLSEALDAFASPVVALQTAVRLPSVVVETGVGRPSAEAPVPRPYVENQPVAGENRSFQSRPGPRRYSN